jgi:hypothetical protein
MSFLMVRRTYSQLQTFCRECGRKMVSLVGAGPFCPKHPDGEAIVSCELRTDLCLPPDITPYKLVDFDEREVMSMS